MLSVLFLRKEDLVFSDDLKAIFKNGCVVTESDDIVYGGLRAAEQKTHCLADDTLDTKLKEQKESFLNIRDFPSRSDIFVRECNIRYQRPCRIYHEKGETDLSMMEMVYVGKEKLIGEVIGLDKKMTTSPVYEETTGYKPGEPVYSTGLPMSVTFRSRNYRQHIRRY